MEKVLDLGSAKATAKLCMEHENVQAVANAARAVMTMSQVLEDMGHALNSLYESLLPLVDDEDQGDGEVKG